MSYEERKAALERALNGSAPSGTYRVAKQTTDSTVVYDQYKNGEIGGEECFRVSYTILDGVVTLGAPELVQEVTTYEPVKGANFSLGKALFDQAEGFVVRTGKVFEVGEYPDKGFSLTEAEADAAIAAFSPVDNDIEHAPSVFDGKLGKLSRVWRDGKDIIGNVVIPMAVNALLGDDPLKVSLAWDRSKKTITGNALVLRPRIADAQLAAAFAASDPVRSGSAMETELKGFMAHMKAFFSGQPIPAQAPTAPAPQPGADAESLRLRTENEMLKGQLAQFAQAQVAGAATSFADSIKDRITPAEREDAIGAYSDALRLDNQDGVHFSADGKPKEGAAVGRIRRMYEGRTPHGLTRTFIQSQPAAQEAGKGDATFGGANDPVDMDGVLGALGVRKKAGVS